MPAPAYINTAERYVLVNRSSVEVGCGFNFREIRTYILDTATGKLVRDIGHAKYSVEKAQKTAASMNARASA